MAEALQEIEDGDVAYVQGSAADPYELKNIGGVYSCSCPAWRNQSKPIDARTCKHLKKYRGVEAEIARLEAVDPDGARAQKRVVATTGNGDDKQKPPVLLAHKWDNEVDLTGWWMSEKLDGVRAYWNGEQFLSRLGNVFLAPEWFTEGFPDHPLDGELWIDRKMFQETVSVVRRMDGGKHWKKIQYVIFDAPAHPGDFEARMEFFQESFSPGELEFAYALDFQQCEGLDHIRDELARVESLGGEGLMLRKPRSTYVSGRSTTLLKVKTFHDAEAIVIDHVAGAGRHKGRLGALRAELPDGTVFSVGTGFSDAEREDPPEVGSIITFRYQELTKAGVPRFPSFVGVRDDVEWPPENAELATSKPAKPSKKKKKKKTKKAAKKKAKKAKKKAAKKKKASAKKARPKQLRDEDGHVCQIEVEGAAVRIRRTFEDVHDAMEYANHFVEALITTGWSAGGKVVVVEDEDEDDDTGESETRRLEFSEGRSNKFWEITVEGASHTVRYGRIGSRGQSKTKDFSSEAAAQASADKLVQSKLKKGYDEVV